MPNDFDKRFISCLQPVSLGPVWGVKVNQRGHNIIKGACPYKKNDPVGRKFTRQKNYV